MWLRPLIVEDDPRVDAERAGRSMVTKPGIEGSIPSGGTEWERSLPARRTLRVHDEAMKASEGGPKMRRYFHWLHGAAITWLVGCAVVGAALILHRGLI